MGIYIFPFLASFLLSLFLTPLVRKLAVQRGYIAKPREDRWHKKETALFGGIAIFISFIIPYTIFMQHSIEVIDIVICGTFIFALGLIDDIRHIKPYTKVIGQIVIASLLVSLGVSIKVIPYQIISIPLTVLWIVAIVNSFNLLDNMDGLSCGIAAIVSGVLFLFAFLNGNFLVALPALILAGSLLGFLRYNFNPAKIFMGDSGSMFIGFVLATITLQGNWKETTHLVMVLAIPVLVLAVPILDTVFVTIARALTSHRIFQGGKDHISHRMVVLGLSDKKTVIALYFISMFFGGISVLSMFVSPIVTLMLVLVASIALIYFALFLGKVKVYTDAAPNDFKKRNGRVILDGMLMHKRRILEVAFDFILICVAYISAYLLRFEGVLLIENQDIIVKSLPIIIIIKYIVFFKFGLYRGIWKYVSLSDLMNIFKAISFSSLASAACILFIWRFQSFSRAVFVIDWLLLFVLISGSRILERIYKELFDQVSLRGRKVLIYGAGNAGEFILREIKQNKLLNYKPVGFLDDDEEKIGRHIHGISVLGARGDMSSIIKSQGVDELIIAIPNLGKEIFNEIEDSCRNLDISYRRIQDVLPK